MEFGFKTNILRGKIMKLVKEYLCDNRIPSDEEIKECIEIAKSEDCVVKLKWFFPRNGWHERYIKTNMTFEEIKDSLPTVYGV